MVKLQADSRSIEECKKVVLELIRSDSNTTVKVQEQKALEPVLIKLLDQLVLYNLGKISTDPQLIEVLLQLIKHFMSTKTRDAKDEERQEKQWDELSKNEKAQRLRFVIYEIYKILNPRQIAGETSLENFINNVQTRGIEVALYYSKLGVEKVLDPEMIAHLENKRPSFSQKLKESGARGYGRGL